uniref:Crossover junction endonuclease MUS81 n=1 Tax=Fundulus heteroclitus TaxID=8078 RepID=A0A3Q2NS54_FUNHE
MCSNENCFLFIYTWMYSNVPHEKRKNILFMLCLKESREKNKEWEVLCSLVFFQAINSLNKYPLPLKNAKEAKILQNFGDGICKILDDKLQRYHRENGPNASIHCLPEGAPPPGRTDNNSLAPSRNVSKTKERRGGGGGAKKKKREYIPQKRSGGYAVLLTLYRHSLIGIKCFIFFLFIPLTSSLKLTLTPFLFSFFFRGQPDLGSKYTAWSSVTTLIQKNLLIKTHNPARYSLTDEGLALAERLEAAEKETENLPGDDGSEGDGREDREEELVVDLTESGDDDEEEEEEEPEVLSQSAPSAVRSRSDAGGASLPEKTQQSLTASRKPNGERLLPGTYEIVLCVDFIETTGGSHHRKQELVKELQRNGVNFDVRKLNVGDFLWVAREKVTPVPGQLRAPAGRELVLDYIIERKRMDDLCGSIIDGRFREQKFRLKRCGLRRPIYLVEGSSSSAAHLSLPEATLLQATVNTQVRVEEPPALYLKFISISCQYLNFHVNRTLTCRSRELEGDVTSDEEERGIPSCSLISFAEFNHGAIKNKCQTVREVFARQLMQISGLSGDKAAAILEHYSTPHSLLQSAYERCGSEAEKEKLLSCVRYGKLKRFAARFMKLLL